MTDTFWALISLLLFIAILVYLKVPAKVGVMLDDRAQRISDELDEARRLREEAQQLLAEYQRKRLQAEKDAQEIVASAKHEAESLAEEARKKTEEFVVRRNKLAEQKIAQAETDAINKVRSTAVDLAIAAANKIISDEVDAKKADTLIKSSLNEVKTRFN